MTQLLLDANYLPLVLKLFAHQDIDKAVDQKNDREDLEYARPLAPSLCQLTNLQLLLLLSPEFQTSSNISTSTRSLTLHLQRRRSRPATDPQASPQPNLSISTADSTTTSRPPRSRRARLPHLGRPAANAPDELRPPLLPHQHQPAPPAAKDHQAQSPPRPPARPVQI